MLIKQKYKFILLILSIVFIFSSITMIFPVQDAYASNVAPTLVKAPLNPAFFANQQSNSSNDQSVQSHPLGYIPSSLLLPNRNVVKKINTTNQPLTSFPTSYDLRTTNKLTDVRDQSTSGSCWAFGAIGSLESTLMPQEKLDFSENNLKNNSGFDWGPNDGGNDYMSMAYLARWDGPVSEADDPYNPNSTSSPKMQPQKHVQGVQLFGYTDQSYSDIKSMLMQSGAVATSFYWNSAYFNNTTNSYYNGNGGYYSNHEVDIVGWDDNYPKGNFSSAPPTDGAFIARNSWGSSWGDQGYFYISYCDYNAGKDNAVFNKAENTNNYSTNYQYDTLGWTDSAGYYGTNTAWIANAFSATSSESLSAISIYTPVPNSTYEIRVYNNFTGTFGTKDPITVGTIAMAGYQTISLGTSIPVNSGERFAVSVKLTTPNYSYPIPMEEPFANYSSKATASPGQSYVSIDGSIWDDLTNYFSNTNICLKVFTTKASANGVISGKVTNANGVPLPGVFIVAENVNSGVSANAVAVSTGKTKTLKNKILSSTSKLRNPKTNSSDITTISNADGTYTLNVPQGNYNLFLWPDPVNNIDYGYQYYDNQLGPATANVIQVTSGQTTTINPTLAVGGKTSGIVTGIDGLGLPDIDVIAYNQYGMGVGTSTDSSGHYEIPSMAATTYKVEFDPTNYNASHGTQYAKQWFDNQLNESSANSVTVVAGQPLVNVNARLHGTNSVISGRVTNAGGDPLPGVWLYVESVDGNASYDKVAVSSGSVKAMKSLRTLNNMKDANNKAIKSERLSYYYAEATTNADGTYSLNVPPGSYKLLVWPGSVNGIDYAYQYYDNKFSWDTADVIQVASDQIKTINPILAVGGKISGVVTGPDGSGLPYIEVYVYNNFAWFGVQTDGTGHYEISGLAATSYKVLFDTGFSNYDHGTNYLRQWYDNQPSESSANSVTVVAGQTTGNINASLAVGGKISGIVTGPDGSGLQYVEVYVVNQDRTSGSWAQTDGSGHYELKGLNTDNYKVQFDPWSSNDNFGTNYARQWYNNQPNESSANPVAVVAGQTTDNINASLTVAGKISGIVTGPDGSGLQYVDVYAYNQDGTSHSWASTDGSGYYELKGLNTDTHKVQFDPWYYNYNHGTNYALQWYDNKPDESSANPVAVVTGQTVPNINAQLQGTGSVPGIPTGLTATPMSSTQISLSWISVSEATSYNVYEAFSANGTFIKIANSTTNSYTHSNLTPGTTHYYKVSAVNASGEGGQSSVASATTFNGTNGVITGRVTNASGKPLAGVYLWVDSVSGDATVDKVAVSQGSMIAMKNKSMKIKNANQYSESTLTDADGNYTLNVPAGNYTMFCWLTSPVDGIDYGYQYYDNKLSRDTADVIQVASEQTKTINPILAVGGRISGVVTDPNGAGLSGIEVIAWNQYGSMGVGTSTDSNGHYEIPGVAATSYKVEFDPSNYNASHGTNYAQQWYNNQPSESSADLVTVVSGTVANINAQLQGTGSVPEIPTGLLATPVSSSQINLSWNSVSGATSYNVYEASSANGTFTKIAITTSNSYTHSNLTPGTTYYYKVSAANASGEGAQSSVTSATTFETNGKISGRVTNVSGGSLPGVRVTAKNLDQESGDITVVSQYDGTYGMYLPQGNYNLSFWADPINDIDYGYQYYNNQLGPNTADVIQVVNGQVKTIDVTMAVGGRMSGQVTDTNGTGLQGIEVMVFNLYGLSVGTETDSNGYYEILGLAATTYKVKFDPTNYNVSHGTNYAQQWYHKKSLAVVAGHAVQNINAKLQGPSSKPGTPTGLTGTAASSTQINLSWDNVSGATSYNVYRATGANGKFSKIASTTTSSYANKNLRPGTTYYYMVSAASMNGEGLQSSAINAITKGIVPAKVQGLTVKGISENQVDLKWSAVSGATSYTIYRSTSPIGTYTVVGTCTSPTVSYSDKNLNATTSYYYKVSALNDNGEGPQSSAAINALIKQSHVPLSNWLINNQKAVS